MLSCRELTEQTTNYLERQLTPWQRLQLRIHLALCHACRGYLHQTTQLMGMLKKLPKEEPPPQVTNTLLETFRKKTGPSSGH